jgi:soluble lytic murein transglycosylase-like protein
MSISKIFTFKSTWVVLTVLMAAGLAWQSVNHYNTTQMLQASLANLEETRASNTRLSSKVVIAETRANSLESQIKQLEAVEARSKDDIRDYILAYYKTVAPTIAEEIAVRTLEKSEAHNVPFVTLVALIEAESHFNPFAISPLKKDPGRGLTQVRYNRWAKTLGLENKYQLHDIGTGIEAGARILKTLLNESDGNMKQALWKYVGVTNNKAAGRAYINKVYANMGKFTVFRSLAGQKAEEEEMAQAADPDPLPVEKAASSKTKRPPKVVTHTVEEGDTLYEIASKYLGDGNKWGKILEVNPGVQELKLEVGSTLVIPKLT